MLFVIALWSFLYPPAQSLPPARSNAWYRSRLPVTMKVTQDVEVKPYSRLELRRRGVLVIGDAKGFTIEKGGTFQITKLLGEGGCRIRVLKKNYDLVSCPWLEGFTDRETDIYQPVSPDEVRGRLSKSPAGQTP